MIYLLKRYIQCIVDHERQIFSWFILQADDSDSFQVLIYPVEFLSPHLIDIDIVSPVFYSLSF